MSDLWSGEFGSEYHVRNGVTEKDVTNRRRLWLEIFKKMSFVPNTILEVGAGNGANLRAISKIYQPSCKYTMLAVETNKDACENLQEGIPYLIGVWNNDFKDINPENNILNLDLIFTYGVLIHQNPANGDLYKMMDKIYDMAGKYIVAVEYFAPELEEVNYRGLNNAMWRGNYGKIYMKNYDCKMIACGFMCKELTGLDNVTYWILEK